MAAFKSAGGFAARVAQLGKELEAAEASRITRSMAEEAQKIATRAASSDLGGDPRFSGWAPRLETQIKPVGRGGHILTPTRSSAGPWTVAEKGRNQGNAGGFAGPGVNRRTGRTSRRRDGAVRRVRASGRSRWNGRTVGKNTASDAVKAMDKAAFKVAETGLRKVIAKHFD